MLRRINNLLIRADKVTDVGMRSVAEAFEQNVNLQHSLKELTYDTSV